MSVLKGETFFEETDFPFHIQRYCFEKGESIPSHTHDFAELVYVVEGGAVHEMANHQYSLSPGDVFVLEPQSYHSYTSSAAGETIVYNVLFTKAFLQKELDTLLQMPGFLDAFFLAPFLRKNASFVPYMSLSPEQRPTIERLLAGILDEYEAKRNGYRLLVKTRWIECLVLLNRHYEESGLLQDRAATAQDEWIASIVHFLQEHYRQPLTLAQLSAASGMSVSSFTAKFKKATGMTFMDYKQSLQIKHACELLRGTDTKILAVAYSAGFQDVSFFNRVFRRAIGMSPREYRRRHRG